ncbi:MAG: hypothetical protein KA419_16255 [Acidobacteria bacterium]|nr:hypothetical protein [Acidobacteriota bacterium]
MPFTRTLTRLINSVHGGRCAVLMDVDCEYVQFAGKVDPYVQKLMGAYQGVILGQVRHLCKLRNTGIPEMLITEYEKARFITQSLRSGYFLVLVLDPAANIGQGMQQIGIAGREINEEID